MHDVSRSETGADRWGERLPRRLGLWSAVAVLIGSTIGSGIFRTPAIIADRVPAAGPMLGVWVLGGLLVLCGALTYAELAAMYPRTGGVFVFLREGFGRLPAFLFGWTELVVIRASALGAIATVFAEYLLRSLGSDPAAHPGPVHYVAAAAILVTATLNYIGVRWSSIVLNLTTAAKYGALVVLFLLAFTLGDGDFAHFTQSDGTVRIGLFGLSLISVLWVYDGWADVSFVSGEVRDPERNLPRALLIGTGGIILIYLLVNLAYLYLLPVGTLRGARLVAADAAQLLVGRVGLALVTVVVAVSTFGTLMGSMLTGPRIFYAMAEDGLFFKGISRVHPRYQTPSRSIAMTATLAAFVVLFLGFEDLSEMFILAIWPFYAMAALAVFVLRRRRPEAARPVRTLGYPLTPLFFVLAGALILANSLRPAADNPLTDFGLFSAPRNPVLSFGVIVLGLPVYWLWRRLTSPGETGPEPPATRPAA
jgi:amino acid transporter